MQHRAENCFFFFPVKNTYPHHKFIDNILEFLVLLGKKSVSKCKVVSPRVWEGVAFSNGEMRIK